MPRRYITVPAALARRHTHACRASGPSALLAKGYLDGLIANGHPVRVEGFPDMTPKHDYADPDYLRRLGAWQADVRAHTPGTATVPYPTPPELPVEDRPFSVLLLGGPDVASYADLLGPGVTHGPAQRTRCRRWSLSLATVLCARYILRHPDCTTAEVNRHLAGKLFIDHLDAGTVKRRSCFTHLTGTKNNQWMADLSHHAGPIPEPGFGPAPKTESTGDRIRDAIAAASTRIRNADAIADAFAERLWFRYRPAGGGPCRFRITALGVKAAREVPRRGGTKDMVARGSPRCRRLVEEAIRRAKANIRYAEETIVDRETHASTRGYYEAELPRMRAQLARLEALLAELTYDKPVTGDPTLCTPPPAPSGPNP